MMLALRASGARETSAAMLLVERAVTLGTVRVTRTYGQLLRTKVRANASGRPGPRAQTGDYRRSIGLEVLTLGGNVYAVVGTNAPQGRRLEYGFMNLRDSLGRLYHQPPYPHFNPALDSLAPAYAIALSQLVASTIDTGGSH